MRQKITTSDYIEKLKKVHGDKYDYSLVEYNGDKSKVKILCSSHGTFEQRADVHLRGSNCPKCSSSKTAEKLRTTTEEFIEKARKVHGDKYDYSKVNYTGCGNKVEIICTKNHTFFQTPSSHLDKLGCVFCNPQGESIRLTTEQFIEKSRKVHGDRYDYSLVNYVNSNSKVEIICSHHKSFFQRPNTHQKGLGCKQCGVDKRVKERTKTTEQFIKESTEKHKGFYTYEKSIYTKAKDNIIITCPNHSDFLQEASHHTRGGGCPKCSTGGYSRTDYIRQAKGRICTFYTIRCFNEEEEFYKIGITVNGTKGRYRNTKEMPYSYEIISEIFGEAGAIWDMEKAGIKKLKDFHYTPQINFGGSKQECFTQYKVNEK